jgi:PPK2 family polyphosphate:nucleotide phosphotransferase
MKDYIEIDSKKKVNLKKLPTQIKPRYRDGKEYQALLNANRSILEESQVLLYSNHARSMLIIFQGMDTAGKDGAISHVMSGVNPQGCSVVSFKTPTSTELEHDYLWKSNCALPVRGQIGIFNRSYYEEALITRVHPELLIKERLPTGSRHGKHFWHTRYQEIVHYEKYLKKQGCDVVKIFIHISKDEQKKRLMARFNDPQKLWKISEGDIRERRFWKEYQKAYEQCLEHTGSENSPWYVVPGDDKDSARLSISQILVDRFNAMKLSYPKLTQADRKKLKELKSSLARE